jgi:hypothetical protein
VLKWPSYYSIVVMKQNPVNKIQGWETIHQKYKGNENMSRHTQPKEKNKSKQSTNDL